MAVEVLPTTHSVSTQTESVQESTNVTTEMHPGTQAIQLLGRISEGEQLQIMANWFSKFASSTYDVRIDSDFLRLSLSASRYLKKCKRGNVVCMA